MKKLNLFLGIGALVIALGLTYANLTLPPDSLMLTVGDQNMPWLGPIIFAIVGIILLATARIGETEISEEASKPAPVVDPEKAALNKRLESIALGCFLILLGGSMFWRPLTNTELPDGVWSICMGLIFLGLNAARYLNQIKMSGFTTVLGILSIVGGVVQLFGVKGLEGAFLLIILGAYLIFKQWFDQRKLFGKAEEG